MKADGNDEARSPSRSGDGKGGDREDEFAVGKLTRAGLVRAVQSAVGLPRRDAAQLVEMVLDEISNRLISREDVKLSSFGTFSVREKRERIGRNPRTGAGAKISARLVVTFKPSNILRARIEGDVSADVGAAPGNGRAKG